MLIFLLMTCFSQCFGEEKECGQCEASVQDYKTILGFKEEIAFIKEKVVSLGREREITEEENVRMTGFLQQLQEENLRLKTDALDMEKKFEERMTGEAAKREEVQEQLKETEREKYKV